MPIRAKKVRARGFAPLIALRRLEWATPNLRAAAVTLP